MSGKRCRLAILALALIIIGMRGLCAAQFSQRASIQKSDAQERLSGTLQFGRTVRHLVDERIESKFVFRVKRYVYVPPAYQSIRTQPATGRKSYSSLCNLCVLCASVVHCCLEKQPQRHRERRGCTEKNSNRRLFGQRRFICKDQPMSAAVSTIRHVQGFDIARPLSIGTLDCVEYQAGPFKQVSRKG
jgi:hypothetical protein